jgi:hypothetical protein
MLKKLAIIALAMGYVSVQAVAPKKRVSTSPARSTSRASIVPAALKDAYHAFTQAIRTHKSKEEIKRLGLTLEKEVHAVIDDASKARYPQHEADKKLNVAQIQSAEQAWTKAVHALSAAEKSGASAAEISQLKESANHALEAYEKRKSQHIINGQLLDIMKI